MQDVSRVTGSPVTINHNGRDFVIRGMNFDDIGLIQKLLVKEKKDAIIAIANEQVRGLFDILPPAERRSILDDARKEAGQVGYLTDDQLFGYLQTMAGSAKLLWTCWERQYPGTITQDEILKMLAGGQLSEDAVKEIMSDLIGANEGNSTGQSSVSPEAASSPATTTS